MKRSIIALILIATACLPLIYLAFIWQGLPQQVPLHFDIYLKPDKIGDKSQLWWPVSIVAAVSIGVYFLFQNIHRIDPKRKAKPSGNFSRLSYVLVIFLAAINFIIVHSAIGEAQSMNLLFPIIGLLFAFIGNYFNSIKPNYFAGYRLPWTLNDDENWRRTHRLAGKMWFWGGLFFTVVSLFLPAFLIIPVFLTMVALLVIIPFVYSYRFFKTKMQH
jgi:uncharacterized membrane protein